jgi:hypothetical protein
VMAPDTPDEFSSAASAGGSSAADQTRFDGSADRPFRSGRLRALPPALENSCRSVRRRFNRRGSMPQFVSGSADGCRGQLRGRSHRRRRGRPATGSWCAGRRRSRIGAAGCRNASSWPPGGWVGRSPAVRGVAARTAAKSVHAEAGTSRDLVLPGTASAHPTEAMMSIQSLHLTGAAMMVSPDSTPVEAAPAGEL